MVPAAAQLLKLTFGIFDLSIFHTLPCPIQRVSPFSSTSKIYLKFGVGEEEGRLAGKGLEVTHSADMLFCLDRM